MDKFPHKPPGSFIIHKESTSAEYEQRPGKPHGVYVIVEIIPGSSAEKAGLKVGDEILSVDGKPATTFEGWLKHACKKADQPMVLKVRDGGIETDVTLVQEYLPTENRYRAGFMFYSELRSEEKVETIDLDGYIVLRHHGKMYDVDGKESCLYQYDLDKVAIECRGLHKENETDLMQRLRSFVLRTPGDETKEIDLLERFNPKNTSVYIAQRSSSKNAGVHKPLTNEVILQRLAGNFFDVHALLHELRHTQQGDNPQLAKLESFYGVENLGRNEESNNGLSSWNPESLAMTLKSISKLAGLKNLGAKLYDDQVWEKLWDIIEGDHDQAVVREKESAMLAIELAPGITIKDLLMLPRRMVERDAEFGALLAERKIREETGIDLFGLYRDYREENRKQNEAFMALESINSAASSSNEKWVKIKDDIKEELKKLEKEGVKSTVVQLVRNYMSSIGATPGIIRKYLEASEEKEV
ncbi:MAG: hypothetical protein A2563_04670 [Candidatus Magasanikbacteria bacterium RIFOXYD1_FULL_40_23]|uniref:PDZ domain-containing protein n=1 Tax=Candidatus Magasanikbacteria bacterium RIFOXYD1_FULL_40_23 TaxID=1798705 RepID=A0A1F6PAR4_9BACT|nr:MAG: hypothetical protein A2563_04670 [Candidatus Magasanikbacteria bacterium RIFOXYD1_FULL_40_23]